MKTVYLCGGINGITDDEAKGWREVAKAAFNGKILVSDPMRRDYRGREDEEYRKIVMYDLQDISVAHALLVNACRPSWGTAMEVFFAASLKDRGGTKMIVSVVPAGQPVSPWLRYYSTYVVPTLEQGIALILERFGS